MARDSTRRVISTRTSAALISLILTYAPSSGTLTTDVQPEDVYRLHRPPFFVKTRTYALSLYRLSTPPNIVLSFSPTSPSDRVTSSRLAFSVPRNVPEFTFQYTAVCGADPIPPARQLWARYPLRPQLYRVYDTSPSTFSRPKPATGKFICVNLAHLAGRAELEACANTTFRGVTHTVQGTLNPVSSAYGTRGHVKH